MADSSVLLSLPQMVDLALNFPEGGIVNFNVLHTLLHVLIQQVDLLECKVEFKGNDSERIQHFMQTVQPGPAITLTEYMVVPGKEQRKVISKKARFKTVDTRGSKEEIVCEKELRVIEQKHDSKEETLYTPEKLGTTSSLQTVVIVETKSTPSTGHVSVALSKAKIDTLGGEVDKLKKDVKDLKDLPTNAGLIEAIRSPNGSQTPVADMFNILTLMKRVDGAEESINKLASIVEDLARETGGGALVEALASIQTDKTDVGVDSIKEPSKSAKDQTTSAKETGTKGTSVKGTTASGKGDELAEIRGKVADLDVRVQALEGVRTSFYSNSNIVNIGGMGPQDASFTTEGAQTTGGSEDVGVSVHMGGGGSPVKRIAELENKFREYSEYINNMDKTFNTQIDTLQQHLTDLEKEIGEIIEKMNAGLPAGDNIGNDADAHELYKKIFTMQAEVERLTGTATKLLDDKDARQAHMDAMLEQIELLKNVKANREDLEDALANKADTCAVNKKVSQNQFGAVCDDLSRSIEQTLMKLKEQEQLWTQTLEDIQAEIGSKLDKLELSALRDFVNNKLKTLQDKVKALAALKQDTEAAGTKSKFLKNVNCLSCDKQVVMRRDVDSLMPQTPALPGTKSISPYLAYELDQLRKQQKCAPFSRNLNHFESALAGSKGDNLHICNRYCGGSHTTTTPQQRVTRVGNFVQQWGQDTPVEKPKSGAPHEYKIIEVADSSIKSKPSILVTGDILSSRGPPSSRKPATPTNSGPPSVKAKE